MIVLPILLLLALGASSAAQDVGKRVHTMELKATRGNAVPTSAEDFRSLVQWLDHDALRLSLKYSDRLSEMDRASARSKLAALHKRAEQLPTKNWGGHVSVAVDIGTPPQALDVMVDTGAGDFWVIEHCENKTECGNIPTFKKEMSSTYRDTNLRYNATYYGGYSALGHLMRDVVSIGSSTGNKTLGVVSAIPGWGNQESGLLGFGLFARYRIEQPWWLQEIDKWEQPLFSLYMPRVRDVYEAFNNPVSDSGHLLLGGIDKTKFEGDLSYIPLHHTQLPDNEPYFWEIDIDAIKVKGKPVVGATQTVDREVDSHGRRAKYSSTAAIDYGTEQIAGPPAEVAALYAAIPGSFQWGGKYWVFPKPSAGESLNITFTFGGVDYQIDEWDAIDGLDQSDGKYCLGVVEENIYPGNFWIVGNRFMKNLYTVFRREPPAVGFAPLLPSAETYFATDWEKLNTTHSVDNTSSSAAAVSQGPASVDANLSPPSEAPRHGGPSPSSASNSGSSAASKSGSRRRCGRFDAAAAVGVAVTFSLALSIS